MHKKKLTIRLSENNAIHNIRRRIPSSIPRILEARKRASIEWGVCVGDIGDEGLGDCKVGLEIQAISNDQVSKVKGERKRERKHVRPCSKNQYYMPLNRHFQTKVATARRWVQRRWGKRWKRGPREGRLFGHRLGSGELGEVCKIMFQVK